MRALITGIRGFAAGHLAQYLQSCGDEVAGSSRAAGDVPAWGRQQITVVPWQLGTRESQIAVRSFLQAFCPDVIYHLSAISIPSRCGGNGPPTPEAITANFESTVEIIETIQELRQPARLVLVSSSHVYAPITAEQPFCDEQYLRQPTSAYAVTKCWAEDALCEAVAQGRIGGVIARAFHHDGPRQKPPGLLPELLRQVIDPQRTEVEVVSLRANFETTDVRDVVRAYRLLAEQGTPGEVYNIGCGRGLFAREIWEKLQAVSGITKPCRELRPETGRQNALADIRKIRAAVGWEPRIALEQTMRDMLAELLNSAP